MDLTWRIYGLAEPVAEYRFHPVRRWRFDYAYIRERIGIEIEGAIWSRGRHTRGSGYLGDMEKYNEATRMGWRIFRFTPQQLKKGIAQAFMLEVFKGVG